MCYGLLQTSPSSLLAFDLPSLSSSANGTAYFYTSLLDESTCEEGGTLTAFHFCYNPFCGNNTDTYDDTAFRVLLLQDINSPRYLVRFVHEERRDLKYCGPGSITPQPSMMHCCCKTISLDKPFNVNSSSPMALAIVVPEEAPGDYLYEVQDDESPGSVFSMSPLFDEFSSARVGNMVNVIVEKNNSIPKRLVQLVLSFESEVQTIHVA